MYFVNIFKNQVRNQSRKSIEMGQKSDFLKTANWIKGEGAQRKK